MTPNDIDVLLHYYCSPAEHPRYEAPAVQETIAEFLRIGLICSRIGGGNSYTITKLGMAHVKQLCDLPIPVTRFVDKNNEVIEYE